MYCSACGNPISTGLSFCNRCGTGLKERSESNTWPIAAFLTAITLIATIGLGIMFGGALTLRKEANLAEPIVGFFMLFTFLTVLVTEVLLVRQLSRLTARPKQLLIPGPQTTFQNELPLPQQRSLGEPVPSVTENTTRTLEYARREPIGK
jgi:hypothetical protein